MAAFVWGDGGAQMTPEAIARAKETATGQPRPLPPQVLARAQAGVAAMLVKAGKKLRFEPVNMGKAIVTARQMPTVRVVAKPKGAS